MKGRNVLKRTSLKVKVMSTRMKVNRTPVKYVKGYCCKPSSKASSVNNELNKTR